MRFHFLNNFRDTIEFRKVIDKLIENYKKNVADEEKKKRQRFSQSVRSICVRRATTSVQHVPQSIRVGIKILIIIDYERATSAKQYFTNFLQWGDNNT